MFWLTGWITEKCGMVGWMFGRCGMDGDVIEAMIFVILQERKKVFICVPIAWLPCREEVRESKNRAGVCVQERIVFLESFSLIMKYIKIRTRKHHEAS